MKKQEFVQRLERFEEQFSGLVWIARRTEEELQGDEAARARCALIVIRNPIEVEALVGDAGHKHHAFNCGCLATVRLILGYLGNSDDAACAEESFPNCDT